MIRWLFSKKTMLEMRASRNSMESIIGTTVSGGKLMGRAKVVSCFGSLRIWYGGMIPVSFMSILRVRSRLPFRVTVCYPCCWTLLALHQKQEFGHNLWYDSFSIRFP